MCADGVAFLSHASALHVLQRLLAAVVGFWAGEIHAEAWVFIVHDGVRCALAGFLDDVGRVRVVRETEARTGYNRIAIVEVGQLPEHVGWGPF